MAHLSASLTLRPTRIGFLVDPNDMDSVRKIFQTCTCLWGGFFNPIIPVSPNLPEAWKERYGLVSPDSRTLSNGYSRFFEPDVFVETTQGLAAMIDIPRGDVDLGYPRTITLDAYLQQQTDRAYDVPFGTEVFGIYRELYEREFKFVPRHERRVSSMATDTTDGAFVEAAFGGFPSEGPLTFIGEAYKDAFDPLILEANAENWVKVYQDGFRYPLDFTREHITRVHGRRREPTLFVVDPRSSLDLLDLWNLRQFHPNILPVNIDWLNASSEFIATFLEQNHPSLPERQRGEMSYPTIQIAGSISEERARNVIASTGLRALTGVEWAFKLWYDDITGGNCDNYDILPQRALVNAATTTLDLMLSEEGRVQRCTFTALSPNFAEQYEDGVARWVNVLSFRNYGAPKDLALCFPSSFTGENSSRLRMGGEAIISREGIVLPQQFKSHGEYLLLPCGQEAIAIWLKSRGVEATPSDPGRIADQIISSLDGFEGVGLIADGDTLKLLDEMSKSVMKYANGKTEEFLDRSIEVRRWKELVSRRANNPFGGRITLDSFIKANVLRLGLLLECTNCRKKNWFGIAGLKEDLTCERCLKNYPFPQGSLQFDRTPWQYRVIGPYSVPNYAEGAYSTVLTLNVFAKRLGSNTANVTFATGQTMRISGSSPFEVDFTLWYQRKRLLALNEEPVLVFGEAKSFAAESFKDEDVARMRRLSEQFPGAFLTFTTLKASLSDSEKRLVGDLARWGRKRLPQGRPQGPVIVLTGTELFSNWQIDQSWKELGGRHAAFVQHKRSNLDNLWSLANLTQQLYLDLPDIHGRSFPPAPVRPAQP